MNFLKTAFWVILAVALALFAKANWTVPPTYSGYIPVKLWDDIIIETRLPILILAAFLIGLVPMWILARTSRWSMRRKLDSAERALASALAPVSAANTDTPVTVAPALPVTPSDPASGPS
ncbi:LapA family protein [Sphingobium subterraneum]|uniref:Lipopolysaccharide assembly protein A domain-containing protein n=1 Tax=Sphingobium subterraneum TaxID=627688 RepID=A0A841J9A8_9SPHN|nr:LapA family protein [Sphingobium subterraneum]MBB6124741.1 hypothetical protein [Sphingobium subterraneum]